MGFKEKIETVQAITTIVAIIVGGLWTYTHFIRERKHYPHATIQHKLSQVRLPSGINILKVALLITNTGTGQLRLKTASIRIQQILPFLPCSKKYPCAKDQISQSINKIQQEEDRFSWPMIAERKINLELPIDIEPGEYDEIDFEFAIRADISHIRVFSYIRNEKKKDLGWALSSYYEFKRNKETTQSQATGKIKSNTNSSDLFPSTNTYSNKNSKKTYTDNKSGSNNKTDSFQKKDILKNEESSKGQQKP